MRSVTHCTSFIKVFFTIKMSYSLHSYPVNLISFTPMRKQRLSCDDLYEADKCSIALFWGTLRVYRKSVKLENKCGECGRKCIHAYKYSMFFTATMSMKLTTTKHTHVNNYCIRLYSNRNKYICNKERISFRFWSKVWCLLQRLSQNLRSLSGIACKSSIPNSFKILKKIWKL